MLMILLLTGAAIGLAVLLASITLAGHAVLADREKWR
jgi:hypothetical protein